MRSELTVGELSRTELRRRMTTIGVRVQIGPIVAAIRSPFRNIHEDFELHYSEHPLLPDHEFADFHLAVEPSDRRPQWMHPRAVFRFGGTSPFKPLPLEQAFALLEWGLNWSIATHCHQYLMLHAAVLAHDDRALVMPAPPGSGKSTLCAALVARGWRLLSDELAVIDPETGRILPMPRPISLKNRSIDAIREFWPEAALSRPVHETLKGTVTYVGPPVASVSAAARPASPRWVVLPRYAKDQSTRLAPLTKAGAFMQLVDNSFNYDVHGRQGFEWLARVTEASDCFEFEYGGALEEAVRAFDDLARRA